MRYSNKPNLSAVLCLVTLLLGGRAFAQTPVRKPAMQAELSLPSPPNAARTRDARRALLLAGLETLLAQVEQNGAAQLQCQVLLRYADLLWETDPGQARGRFEQAWLATAAIAPAPASNPADTASEWHNPRQQMRQAILDALFKRAPQLARQFAESWLSASRDATAEEKAAAQTLWLDVTTQLAATEPAPDDLAPSSAQPPAQLPADAARFNETLARMLATRPGGIETTKLNELLTKAEWITLQQAPRAWQQPDLAATLAEHRELTDPLQRTLAFVMLAHTLRAQQANDRADASLAELEAWLASAADKENQAQAWLALAEEHLTRNPAHAAELFRRALQADPSKVYSAPLLAAFTATLTKFAEADFEHAWALAGNAGSLSVEVNLKLALSQSLQAGDGESPL